MEQASGGALFIFIVLAWGVFYLAATWRLYNKAGEPGWAAIIPIYQLVVFYRVGGKPGWWFLLYLIPIVDIIVLWLASVGIAKRFGKGVLFGAGIFFLPFIFVPVLAFGGSTCRATTQPAY
jgi:hypothetical protein